MWEIVGYILLSYVIMWLVIQNKHRNGLWEACMMDARPIYEVDRETIARQTLTMMFVSAPFSLIGFTVYYLVLRFLRMVHRKVNDEDSL